MLISSTSRSFGVLCLSAASALVWAQDPAAPRPRPALRGIAVTRLDEGSRLSELESAQRLTVSFAHAVSIRDALFLLVRGTPFTVAIDPSAKGTFAGELTDVTLRQAIDAVLTPNGLSYDLDGAVIRVFPRRTETRVFDLNVTDYADRLDRVGAYVVPQISGDGVVQLSLSRRGPAKPPRRRLRRRSA